MSLLGCVLPRLSTVTCCRAEGTNCDSHRDMKLPADLSIFSRALFSRVMFLKPKYSSFFFFFLKQWQNAKSVHPSLFRHPVGVVVWIREISHFVTCHFLPPPPSYPYVTSSAFKKSRCYILVTWQRDAAEGIYWYWKCKCTVCLLI